MKKLTLLLASTIISTSVFAEVFFQNFPTIAVSVRAATNAEAYTKCNAELTKQKEKVDKLGSIGVAPIAIKECSVSSVGSYTTDSEANGAIYLLR